jgi:methionyl-tRNA synthetase
MKPEITFDDFLKVDIRTGTIKTVESVPKSKKLLKLTVDFGSLGERTIMAGIAQNTPYGSVVDGVWQDSCLVGQHVLAVVNLAPRNMMGVDSHGMLLAGHDTVENQVYLATIPPMVANGGEIG